MKKISFDLTPDQVRAISSLRNMVEKYNAENNPKLDPNQAPGIIAQLDESYDFENPAVMICKAVFVPNEKLKRMQKAMMGK